MSAGLRTTREWFVSAAASAAVLAMFLPGFAESPRSSYRGVPIPSPDPQELGQWGTRVVAAGDLNDDGVQDVYVAAPGTSQHPPASVQTGGEGRVYAMSGKALASGRNPVLFQIDPPEPQPHRSFGFSIAAVEPATKAAQGLIAIGAHGQDIGPACVGEQADPTTCEYGRGKAWVFSAKDGKLLYALDNPGNGTGALFGSRLGRAGDINEDGISETIVGAPGNDVPTGCTIKGAPPSPDCSPSQGQAFIFNGKDGTLIRTLDLPPAERQSVPKKGACSRDCVSFGLAVQGVGDIDGDHVTDQMVDAAHYKVCAGQSCRQDQGRMYVFSGKSGQLFRTMDDPEPQVGALFGFQDSAPLAPGDLDGDGVAEVYGNGFLQDGSAGKGQGKGWVFSGKSGKVLFGVNDPRPAKGGQFGWSMATTDANGDGKLDLVVGSAPHHLPGEDPNGGVEILDGVSRREIASLQLPARFKQTPKQTGSNSTGAFGQPPALGWGLAAPGDLNGDGRGDVLAGAPGTDAGAHRDQGLLMLYLSQPAASGRPTSAFAPNFMIGIVVTGVLAAGIAVAMRARRRDNE